MSASAEALLCVSDATTRGLAVHGQLGRPLVLQGPRLQLLVSATGLSRGSLWAGGELPDIAFEPPLPADTRWTITPNEACARWLGGTLRVALASAAPVVVLSGEGTLPSLRLRPRRGGQWTHAPARSSWDGPGASLRWQRPGFEQHARGWAWGPERRAMIAAGANAAEADAALAALLAVHQPLAGLRRHQQALAAVLHVDDPLLSTLFVHGLHTALSAERRHPDGRFAGMAAGFGYVEPARSYYRDAYWTLQVLLPLRPDLAHAQLRLLAREVDDQGRAPSGVIVAEGAAAARWATRRTHDPQLAHDHPHAGGWWADHSDSPLYFALLAAEVARWTGQGAALLDERVADRTLDARLRDVLAGLQRASDTQGLPLKPLHDRDWADNVIRSGAVTYLAALAHGALMAAAELYAQRDPALTADCRRRAARLRAAASRRLWQPAAGHYAEFVTAAGERATHLAIDTSSALRFGLATAAQARALLQAMREQLETRHQPAQPWGDWGLMSVYPPYPAWVRRRGKSRFGYRYHNGGAWPVWSGVVAEARLARRCHGWYYPLTRSWSYGLAQGWPNPVEYHSPPYPPGSPVNGWSAMPAAAMLLGGWGLTPAGPQHPPPWGATRLTLPRQGGGTRHLASDSHGNLEVTDDG